MSHWNKWRIPQWAEHKKMKKTLVNQAWGYLLGIRDCEDDFPAASS